MFEKAVKLERGFSDKFSGEILSDLMTSPTILTRFSCLVEFYYNSIDYFLY